MSKNIMQYSFDEHSAIIQNARTEVFTMIARWRIVLRDVTSCNLIEIHRRLLLACWDSLRPWWRSHDVPPKRLPNYRDRRISSSGMWCRVVRWVSTDVSEEHIASIFRVEEISSTKKTASKQVATCLKMEAICSSRTSVDTQRTTRRHIPEDDTLHNHRCENLKSYIPR
jgi:hypothetical protein